MMFCEKCGKQNGDDAAFCENCGADLRSISAQEPFLPQGGTSVSLRGSREGAPMQRATSPIQGNLEKAPMQRAAFPIQENQAVKAPVKKPFPKMLIVIGAEIMLLGILMFYSAHLENKIKKPQYVAETYFLNFVNGDWEKAFLQLELDREWSSDDKFITYEGFEKAQAGNNLGIVEEYQVNEDQQEAGMNREQSLFGDYQDGENRQEKELTGVQSIMQALDRQTGKELKDDGPFFKEVVIDYREQGETKVQSYTVPLQKNDRNNWKVSGADLVCRGYSIYVPKDASVSVDDIVLGEEFVFREGDEGYSYGELERYYIPYIFYGYHDIEVSMEGMEDVSKTIQIENGDSYYQLEKMSVKQETLDELIELGRENMQKIYSAAMEGKNFSAIEELFTADQETKREIQESYESLMSDIHEGSVQIEKVSFLNLSGEASGEGGSVSIGFDYEMQYVEEDGWSGELERDTYKGSDNWQFYFVNENGKWVQTNLGCGELY